MVLLLSVHKRIDDYTDLSVNGQFTGNQQTELQGNKDAHEPKQTGVSFFYLCCFTLIHKAIDC